MAIPVVEVVAGVIRSGPMVLLAQRGAEDSLAHLWEFPGGKVKSGETHSQALIRELKEELDIVAEVGEAVASTRVFQNQRVLALHSYLVTSYQGKPKALVHQKLAWVEIKDLNQYPMPEPDGPIVQWLRQNG